MGARSHDGLERATKIILNEEYAALVPDLTHEEYELLKESIKNNGLWVPIVINQDNVILDGYHRYKACKELGIKQPKFIRKTFADNFEGVLFVIDSNLRRRQLSDYQKVQLALKSRSILELNAKRNNTANLPKVRHLSLGKTLGKDKDDDHDKNGEKIGSKDLFPPLSVTKKMGRVDEQIGKMAGVSRDTVRKVQKIQESCTNQMKQKLVTGQLSINQAHKMIEEKQKREEPKIAMNPVRAREEINDLCKKLFKILTDMELDSGDLNRGDMQVNSKQAQDHMNEIITYYIQHREIAAMQYIVIPTNKLLTKFRDMLYESVESNSDKDKMFRE